MRTGDGRIDRQRSLSVKIPFYPLGTQPYKSKNKNNTYECNNKGNKNLINLKYADY